jgi:hypothetical protein
MSLFDDVLAVVSTFELLYAYVIRGCCCCFHVMWGYVMLIVGNRVGRENILGCVFNSLFVDKFVHVVMFVKNKMPYRFRPNILMRGVCMI